MSSARQPNWQRLWNQEKKIWRYFRFQVNVLFHFTVHCQWQEHPFLFRLFGWIPVMRTTAHPIAAPIHILSIITRPSYLTPALLAASHNIVLYWERNIRVNNSSNCIFPKLRMSDIDSSTKFNPIYLTYLTLPSHTGGSDIRLSPLSFITVELRILCW